MSDNPQRIPFESLLTSENYYCINTIPPNKQAWYNRQKKGQSYRYNPNSDKEFKALLFTSSLQPTILFISISIIKSYSKNSSHNPNYDSSSGRSYNLNSRCDSFNLPRIFIRLIPKDWDTSLLDSNDPLHIFNNGLKDQLNYT